MKRIVLADDKKNEFEELHAAWCAAGNKSWQLEYCDLDELISDTNDLVLATLIDNPPDVLLLDWEGGSVTDVYSHLKENIPLIIIVSQYNESFLDMDGVFKKYPELKGRMLTKPVDIKQLQGLIERDATSERRKSTNDWGDFFALRFLDENRSPIGVSKAWTLGLDRPALTWEPQQLLDLSNGMDVHHSFFSISAIDPQRFGLIQLTTKKVLPKMKVPHGAVYFQQAYDLPNEGVRIENIGRSVDGIINMMKDAGFKRGRYYHISDVPGIDNYMLEMIARSPIDSGNLALPAANELDEEEEKTYTEFCDEFSKTPNRFIFRVTPNDYHKHGLSAPFWNQCIDVKGVVNVLRIPVFLSKNEVARKSDKFEHSKVKMMRGEFIFDKGKGEKIDDNEVERIKLPLLAALKYFAIARNEEHDEFERRIDLVISKNQKEFMKCTTIHDIESALVGAVVETMKYVQADMLGNENGVQRGALFARYTKQIKMLEVAYEISGNGATNDYMYGLSFDITNQECDCLPIVDCAKKFVENQKITPSFHPSYRLTDAAREKRRKGYRTATTDEARINRLMARLGTDIKTLVAFPVALGKNLLGVLVTRSAHPYEFTSRIVETIQKVIETGLPYLTRLLEKERTRNWNATVMHEMRSTLSKAKWRLAEMKDNNENDFSDIEHILEHGIGISSLFLKWLGMQNENHLDLDRATDIPFWSRIDDNGKYYSKISRNKCRWKIDFYNDVQIRYAKDGASAILFERVLSILIDNAFRYAKHGSTVHFSCDVEGDAFVVKISNMVNQNELDDNMQTCFVNDNESVISSKAAIGITLVRMICADVKAQFRANVEPNGEHSQFEVEIKWPFVEERKNGN